MSVREIRLQNLPKMGSKVSAESFQSAQFTSKRLLRPFPSQMLAQRSSACFDHLAKNQPALEFSSFFLPSPGKKHEHVSCQTR